MSKLARNGGDSSGVVMVVGIVSCMLVGLRVFESRVAMVLLSS